MLSQASQATSASFVKAGRVNAGVSLLSGIAQRYATAADERCGLAESELTFEGDNSASKPIELYGMMKCSQRMSQLASLQSVMLPGVPVASFGPDGHLLASQLPCLTDLCLGHTLVHDWAEIAAMVRGLPTLRALNLSQNVLASPIGFVPDPPDAFARLESLVLNKAGLDWPGVLTLWRLMPALRHLAVSHNHISFAGDAAAAAAGRQDLPPHAASLVELDLAHNNLANSAGSCFITWLGRRLPGLRLLNLTGCQLAELRLTDSGSGDTGGDGPLPSLESLILAGNQLTDWGSVAELHRLPRLASLMLMDNPLWRAQDEGTSRQLVIARLPRLRLLNRSAIERDERVGAQIDYLKRHYAQYRDLAAGSAEAAAFAWLHPSYVDLLKKLGPPDEADLAGGKARSLKDSVLEVRLRCTRVATGEEHKQQLTKRLPGRMLVQHLIAFIRKAFRLPATADVRLCYLCDKNPGTEYPMEVETREVLYYNIASGDTILAKY